MPSKKGDTVCCRDCSSGDKEQVVGFSEEALVRVGLGKGALDKNALCKRALARVPLDDLYGVFLDTVPGGILSGSPSLSLKRTHPWTLN